MLNPVNLMIFSKRTTYRNCEIQDESRNFYMLIIITGKIT